MEDSKPPSPPLTRSKSASPLGTRTGSADIVPTSSVSTDTSLIMNPEMQAMFDAALKENKDANTASQVAVEVSARKDRNDAENRITAAREAAEASARREQNDAEQRITAAREAAEACASDAQKAVEARARDAQKAHDERQRKQADDFNESLKSQATQFTDTLTKLLTQMSVQAAPPPAPAVATSLPSLTLVGLQEMVLNGTTCDPANNDFYHDGTKQSDGLLTHIVWKLDHKKEYYRINDRGNIVTIQRDFVWPHVTGEKDNNKANMLTHCNFFNKTIIPFDHLPGSFVEYRELNNRL